jgi:hypothetical protein
MVVGSSARRAVPFSQDHIGPGYRQRSVGTIVGTSRLLSKNAEQFRGF